MFRTGGTTTIRGRNMSLIVALANNDSVIVAVDSRTTWQNDSKTVDRYTDNTDKLIKLDDKCVLAHWGNNAEMTNSLLAYLDKKIDTSSHNATRIAQDVARCLRNYCAEHLKGVPPSLIEKEDVLPFMVAGIDEGNPVIYLLSSKTFLWEPQLYKYKFCDGIEEIASYWMSKFKLEDAIFSVEELKRLALWLQVETAFWHQRVGGAIKIVTITNEKQMKDVVDLEDVKREKIRDITTSVISEWCMNAK